MKEASSFFSQTYQARKIVVVDFGFLGDTVHLIPALWDLQSNYPEAELHVVTTEVGGEVLKMAPCVQKVWTYKLTNPSPPWYNSLGLVWQLRKEKFDALFNFSGADRTVYLGATLGVKNKLTQRTHRWHFYNPLLSRYWAPEHNSEDTRSVYQLRRQMLRAGGLHLGLDRFELRIPEEIYTEVSEWICEGAIHLSPNTSSFFKEWPVNRWAELIRLISARCPSEVMLMSCSGAEREQERVNAIVSKANCSQLKLLPPGMKILQLAAVISRCKLHIGGDSGPLHLAWALKVPTITICRNYSDMEQWMPKGKEHERLTCKCYCMNTANPECVLRKESLCLSDISAEKVFEVLMKKI